MSHLDIFNFAIFRRFSWYEMLFYFFHVMLASLTNETFWVKFQQLLVYFWPFYIVNQQVERWKEQGYYHKEWWYLFDLCRTTTPFRPFSPEKSPIFLMGTIAWWPILDVRHFPHLFQNWPKYWRRPSNISGLLLPINLTKGTKEGWGPKIDKFFSNFSGMVVTTRWRSFE